MSRRRFTTIDFNILSFKVPRRIQSEKVLRHNLYDYRNDLIYDKMNKFKQSSSIDEKCAIYNDVTALHQEYKMDNPRMYKEVNDFLDTAFDGFLKKEHVQRRTVFNTVTRGKTFRLSEYISKKDIVKQRKKFIELKMWYEKTCDQVAQQKIYMRLRNFIIDHNVRDKQLVDEIQTYLKQFVQVKKRRSTKIRIV